MPFHRPRISLAVSISSVSPRLSLWAHDLTVIMTLIRLNGFADNSITYEFASSLSAFRFRGYATRKCAKFSREDFAF